MCLCAMVAMCVSCNSNKSKLQIAVEEAQKQCPMDMGVIGKVSSFTYENGVLTIEMCMNENIFKVDALSTDIDAAKRSALNSLSTLTGDIKNVMSELVNEKAALVYRYVGDQTQKSVEVKLTYEEVEAAINASPDDVNYEEELQSQIKTANTQCPNQVDQMTVLDSISQNDEFVIYNYTVAEDNIKITDMEGQATNMKAMLAANMQQNMAAMRIFLLCCINTNHGLQYRYVGSESGQEFNIYFAKGNLQELIGE